MSILSTTRASGFRRFALPAALAALVVAPLAGCDSTNTSQLTVRGRVTDNAATSGTAPASGAVEGAAVIAARIGASGQLQALSGTATTGADGSYSLTTQGTSDALVLTATRGDFSSRALIEARGADRGTIQAPPMTAETDAEAAVYLSLRTQASTSPATVTDAVYYVTSDVAARIDAGTTTAASVATALDAAVQAEAAYIDRTARQRADQARSRRVAAYAAFRTALAGTDSDEARESARRAFEGAYASSYTDAGASADVQAGAAVAASRASLRFSGGLSGAGAFAMERQARLYAAQSAALAVEAAFRARNAGSARMTALTEARTTFLTAVHAATSANAIAAAEAQYRAAVRTELTAETGLTDAQIQLAEGASGTARATLETAIAAAVSAGAIGEAVATYYTAARSAIASSLGSGAAELAVDVVTMLSATSGAPA